MGAQTAPLRVVLDTNVVLSALLFRGGRLGSLRAAWQRGEIRPLIDRDTASELVRALAYPKFGLDQAAIEALLGEYLPAAETVAPGRTPPGLPRCADADDQKFVNLAARGKADALVTGDAALRRLAATARFEILEPAALIARLNR